MPEEDVVEAEAEEDCVDDGVLYGLGGTRERKALIFKLAKGGGDAEAAALSYSSMRLARSSSDFMDTRASRSSAGN